jgi:hypothetical protein
MRPDKHHFAFFVPVYCAIVGLKLHPVKSLSWRLPHIFRSGSLTRMRCLPFAVALVLCRLDMLLQTGDHRFEQKADTASLAGEILCPSCLPQGSDWP